MFNVINEKKKKHISHMNPSKVSWLQIWPNFWNGHPAKVEAIFSISSWSGYFYQEVDPENPRGPTFRRRNR